MIFLHDLCSIFEDVIYWRDFTLNANHKSSDLNESRYSMDNLDPNYLVQPRIGYTYTSRQIYYKRFLFWLLANSLMTITDKIASGNPIHFRCTISTELDEDNLIFITI